MRDLKHISNKQLNEFIKGKGFKGRDNHKLKELKGKFGFKPMYDRRTLVIPSEDMEPKMFDSLKKGYKAIAISYGALRYAKNEEREISLKKIRYMR